MNDDSVYEGVIKIFADTAKMDSFLQWSDNALIKGFTTNPTFLKLARVTDYRAHCKEVIDVIGNKPISLPVLTDDLAEIEKQACEISAWGHSVYVKIPIMNSTGLSCAPMIQALSRKKIKVNATAIFTHEQALLAARSLKRGAPSIISIFAGKIADTGRDAENYVKKCVEDCAAIDQDIEILWAATREAYNIVQAEAAGCHIVTALPEIIKKLHIDNNLHEMSLQTIKQFSIDAQSLCQK